MSLLALLSGKATSDAEVLRELHDAVMQLQVEALGKRDAFDLKPDDIARSRRTVVELLEMLRGLLSQPVELQFVIPKTPREGAAKDIVLKLEARGRPKSDWIEDIEATRRNLQQDKPLSDADWGILEDIVSVLDMELAQDLRALSQK